MSARKTPIIQKLCQSSVSEYNNPYETLVWPDRIEQDCWYTSPELISLFGTELWEQLSDEKRYQLSLLEAANFFSLNIHGEKALIEGLARRLYSKRNSEISQYLHHFLDEENKHMLYFGTFCSNYVGKIYPQLKVAFSQQYDPGQEDFLFFTKVMIFEEIVDAFNIRMAIDERLHPLARQINQMHHRDEARHLVFGREIVLQLLQENKDKWNADTLAYIREHLTSYLKATWKEFYNPEVYKDLDLPHPYEVQRIAFQGESARRLRSELSSSCIKFLLKHSILQEEPQL